MSTWASTVVRISWILHSQHVPWISALRSAKLIRGLLATTQIDLMTLSWAIHRLSGISSPANAAYSLEEIVYQLKSSGSKALFTCAPLLPIALEAAAKSGIPKNRVYLLALPKVALGGKAVPKEFKTVDDLIAEGSELPALEPLKWERGRGARQTAFLCYSSGTSGLPVSFLELLEPSSVAETNEN